MVKNYCPDRGDIIWLDFDPQTGREQKGRRPALVLSPKSYNQKVSLSICVPITSHKNGYPFEVEIKSKKISGVVLSDHIKNLHWKIRKAEFIETISKEKLEQVLEMINLIIGTN